MVRLARLVRLDHESILSQRGSEYPRKRIRSRDSSESQLAFGYRASVLRCPNPAFWATEVRWQRREDAPLLL